MNDASCLAAVISLALVVCVSAAIVWHNRREDRREWERRKRAALRGMR